MHVSHLEHRLASEGAVEVSDEGWFCVRCVSLELPVPWLGHCCSH